MKYSLSKKQLLKDAPEYEFSSIKREVQARMETTRAYAALQLSAANLKLLDPKLYGADGGVKMSKQVFDKFASPYFLKSRRAVEYAGQVYLRGTRYTISANPTFELRQKLNTFKEDLDEGLAELTVENNPLFQLAIADYIKNSVVTMLNSYLHEEKTGKYRFESVSYQAVRKEGQAYAQATVDLFYGVMLQSQRLASDGYRQLVERRKIFDKMQEHIVEEYERGVFSSRHITRREASHPLIIAAAVAQYAREGMRGPEVIVGLPSGGTELALAHATGQRLLNNNFSSVLLVPISLHSAKSEFDSVQLEPSDLRRWATHHRKELSRKKVVVVDDNSSTGRTIQLLVDLLVKEKARVVQVAVAEADVVRSEIDRSDSTRSHIASRALYSHSVSVLAVSKWLRPKRDLKEMLERQKMAKCVASRYINKPSDHSRVLIGKVYQDLLAQSTEDVLAGPVGNPTIRKFRKTFLSNFWPTRVSIDGGIYESVEHAYQAMKFSPDVWGKITSHDVNAINRKLEDRGAHVSLESLPYLFVDPDVSAGSAKVAANYLRILGYVRNDWDDVKVPIMANLLLQKYSDDKLYGMLQETTGQYLIEGNDWNDTFWGECNGRGRNVLGRMLMVIRDMTLTDISAAASTPQAVELPVRLNA